MVGPPPKKKNDTKVINVIWLVVIILKKVVTYFPNKCDIFRLDYHISLIHCTTRDFTKFLSTHQF